jgi:hypothetical protein
MKGKIYALKSNQTNDIYIGSTIDRLCNRKAKHKNKYKRFLKNEYHFVTSFNIIKYDDCYIELLQEVNINDKKELYKIEGEWIKKTKNCINRCIAGRTRKEWGQDHKDKWRMYNQRRNKEETKKYHNDYYHKNKDIINKKILCSCGSYIIKSSKARHERTKKHISFLS